MLTYNTTIKVYTWNLPAGRACPGATGYCAKHCYGKHVHFLYPSTKRSHEKNFQLSRGAQFVRQMIFECQASCIVRIHSSGDFYASSYIDKWCEIVKTCPGTIFYAYTRTWRLPVFHAHLHALNTLPNMYLIASQDPTCMHETIPDFFAKKSFFGTAPELKTFGLTQNCLKQLEHGHGCPECGRCFDRVTKQIIFKQH